MKVAIVGGGIIGLTTALQLNNHFRNTSITIYAESYDKLVSHVAAGLFRVGNTFCGPTKEITKQWIKDSYQYYEEINQNYEPMIAGVGQNEVYMYSNTASSVKSYLMEAVVPYRNLTPDEFEMVGGNWKFGSHFPTLVIQNIYHLPWARNKLEKSGVKFVTKSLKSLKELVDDYDMIWNCTGLGAKELCSDDKMIPIRGQVIKMYAPWVKNTYYGDLDTYIIPGVDGTCTLGGTRNFESHKTNICPHDMKSIRERCEELVPSLAEGRSLDHICGLRPHREGGVRIELEKVSNGQQKAIVVHNYGHGGYGVTTAPGTAKYSIDIAKDYHKLSFSKL